MPIMKPHHPKTLHRDLLDAGGIGQSAWEPRPDDRRADLADRRLSGCDRMPLCLPSSRPLTQTFAGFDEILEEPAEVRRSIATGR